MELVRKRKPRESSSREAVESGGPSTAWRRAFIAAGALCPLAGHDAQPHSPHYRRVGRYRLDLLVDF